MVKKILPFLGTLPFTDVCRNNTYLCILRKGRKGFIRLVGQVIPVSQEQDGGTSRGLPFLMPVSQVPATIKQLPGQFKGDEGLAGPVARVSKIRCFWSAMAANTRSMAMS